MIDVHSFTGDEQPMAELMVSLYGRAGAAMGLGKVQVASRSRTAARTLRSARGWARDAAAVAARR